MPIPNVSDQQEQAATRKNAEWRIRLHRQLDALCDDAEARKGFFGKVIFEIIYESRRVTRFNTNIGQSVHE